jgi:FKBP-type peptidyl-prolyl cis-trans isomerase SlyD
MSELEGKTVGEKISVALDSDKLFGPRDESLVVTDYIENVPEEYRELGTRIVMENEQGETKTFLVTRIDETTLTIDGNNPLCGRDVVFELEILTVREATDAEVAAGGKVEKPPVLKGVTPVPL